MSSRHNTLRYGSMRDARQIADGDSVLPDEYLRALVLNILDNVIALQRELEELRDSRNGE